MSRGPWWDEGLLEKADKFDADQVEWLVATVNQLLYHGTMDEDLERAGREFPMFYHFTVEDGEAERRWMPRNWWLIFAGGVL